MWLLYFDFRRRVLIDAGEPGKPDYRSLLNSVLSEHKIEISSIIVTHHHHDHVGGVDDVCTDVIRPKAGNRIGIVFAYIKT